MKASTALYCFAFLFLVKVFDFAQQGLTVPAIPPADASQVQQEIHQVEATLASLPDRGVALFLLAHDYAHLGIFEKAFSLLTECISLDEGFNPEDDPAFLGLKDNAEFRKLIERPRSTILGRGRSLILLSSSRCVSP
jgi:hypothetical protein